MITSTPESQNLPLWITIFSFIASLLLTILKIIEGILKSLRKSNLEVVLTREVFFRIFESGESIYLNAVIIAHDEGALIKDISASLRRENGATKEFKLKISQIGEKYRTSDGQYQFSFYSSSPLTFVPGNSPQRQVYICEHLSYADATKQEFQRFQNILYGMKEKYRAMPVDGGLESAQNQLLSDINTAINYASANIMDKIQIEAGKYTLSVTITYRQKRKYLSIFTTKKAESKVQFVVENYARELMKNSLNEYLRRKVDQVLLDKTVILSAPEYLPSNIREF